MSKTDILTARKFEHTTCKNSDGTPARARQNGKTQVWVTRPDDFRIPVKHGLWDYFNITPVNVNQWKAV